MPPVLSLVSAMYGVAEYLPEYLAGLDEQGIDFARVEFVFVDDGSPDDSAALVEAWQGQHPERNVRLIRQANTGQAGARNAGLAVATGSWVSFPDPDDVLAPGYLAEVLRFVDSPEAGDVAIVVANLLRLDDGRVLDQHLLRHRFARGTRVADLATEPDLTVVSASHTFLRRAVLAERGLRQDERVRPVWEDGHLVARYLGGWERPRLALLPNARYLYRRRGDSSSSMQGAWADPRKFSDVPRYGWLDALRVVEAERGRVPEWLAHMVLYDLIGYFERERQSPSVTAWLSAEQQADFLTKAAEVLEHVDAAAIESYRTTPVTPEIRQALRFGFKGATEPYAVIDRTDPGRRVERVHYFFTGDRPTEDFGFRPRYATYRSTPFYGRVLMHERAAWVPTDRRVTLELDGRPVRIERLPAPRREGARALLREHGVATMAKAETLRIAARTPWARRRYGHAWVVLDRDTSAGDNGEHFYRWLRTHRPEVNAWFLLRRDSPDWNRLAADGFRLLAFRSPQHYLALLNARHLISSQLDRYVTGMLPRPFGPPRWRFTFLQHGVTKDDQSGWFDPKPIALLVTSTQDEQDAIVGDGSPYLVTGLEAKRTGMPRLDRLLDLAATTPPDERDVLLVMPTWRLSLPTDGVWESEWGRQWRAVLDSDRLRKVADAHGWRLEFVAHPNLAGHLDQHPLPAHVTVHRADAIDLQRTFARTRALLTDYSSVAFDLAYLERPVVYFQFDQADVFGGRHIYKRGAWSYEQQGFGPVLTDAEATVDAVVALIERGGAAEPEYVRRLAAAFGERDGGCCERTYRAVRDLYRPLTPDEVSAP